MSTQLVAQKQSIDNHRILIVDDDATMRLLMNETLQEDGYIIDEADNGFDALQSIKAVQPDLVLLDVRMPGLSGFDVCAEIRELSGDTNIAIVMVTGLEDSESIETAFQLGATAFISKPINWITFPYRIQYILKARDAFVELQQKEMHLRHMERISRTISQNKHVTAIMQEAMLALLDIFSGDRTFIMQLNNVQCDEMEISYEVVRDNVCSVKNNIDVVLDEMEPGIIDRAADTDLPILSVFNETAVSNTKLKVHQQMLIAMHLRESATCYLVIQQSVSNKPWSDIDVDTFYRAGLRLSNMLSNQILLEKLHNSEQLLQQAQRIGHLGNWQYSIANKQLDWSDEVYRILGYLPATFAPDFNACYRISNEQDQQRLELLRQSAIATGKAYSLEYRIQLPGDELRWVHEQGIGAHTDHGEPTAINGTLQDITDHKRKQEQEVHESKMEAIGQLTSGVAHDFGNLMTVARGNLELLQDTLQHHKLDEESSEILEDARSAVHDGVELTKQLLSFSRKKSIAPEYVNIATTLNKFSHLLSHTMGDNIDFMLHVETNLPDILVDNAQLESALLNVCINARNAMPNGGTLNIDAELTPESATLNNKEANNNHDRIVISIRDNGIGMNEEVLGHAIEPFFTTRKQEGTGLGLSTVYGFMRQSGGELQIDSTLGEGTTLRMVFPVYGGIASEQATVEYQQALPIKHTTILIVEDRNNVRQFAARCLNNLDLNILQAQDATEAQQLIAADNSIDLLFTDILMPGDLDGRELARWTRCNHPDIKILLTTASERQAKHQDAQPSYNFPLIPKPYNKQELIKAIHRALLS